MKKDNKDPLPDKLFVQHASNFEQMMYEEMVKDKLKLKQIKTILEGCDEK